MEGRRVLRDSWRNHAGSNSLSVALLLLLKRCPTVTGLDRPKGLQAVEVSGISTQSAQECGKVASPTHRLPLLPADIPGIYLC